MIDNEFNRRRKQRALATGLLLTALCVLFYFITIAKISGKA